MTTSAELTNFWEHYSQTALNKDIGVSGTAVKRPGHSSSFDTSSFLAVPTKNNYTPISPKKNHNQLVSLFSTHSSLAKAILGQNKRFPNSTAITQDHNSTHMTSPGCPGNFKFLPNYFTTKSDTSAVGTLKNNCNETQASQNDSLVTYLNFRDLMVPQMLHGLLQGQTSTKDTDLNAVYLRWPEILPPDSHWYLISQLRIHAGAPERSDVGAKKLCDYFDILLWLENTFLFEIDGVTDTPFSWFESFFPGRKVTSGCIQYEKSAVLFNLGAVYSQLAASQQIWTPGGIKLASVYFQKASGIFIYIRDTLSTRLRIKLDPTSDLSQGTLNALGEIMLAQAHECFVEKANNDAASSSVTSQISAQTAEHYELALQVAKTDVQDNAMSPTTPGLAAMIQRTLSSTSTKSPTRFPIDWMSTIQSKVLLFTAFSHFHAPGTLGLDVAIGERISRLIIAKTLAERAVDEGKHANEMTTRALVFYLGQIAGALHVAEVTNVQKYQVGIVDPRHLTPLRRLTQSCVSSTPFIGPGLSDASQGLALDHASFSTDPSIQSAWKRSIILLADILVLAGESQSALDSIDNIISQFQTAQVVRPMSKRQPIDRSYMESMDETTVLALANRVHSLAIEESILPARTMLCSLLSTLQRSQSRISVIKANLDRANSTGHLEGSPVAYTLANSIQSKLASATTEIKSLQASYDTVSSLFKPNGILFGFQPEEWPQRRLVSLYMKFSQINHDEKPSDLFPESLCALTQVRDEISLFLSNLAEQPLNMSVETIVTGVQKWQSLVDEKAKKVRSYTPELINQSKHVLEKNITSNQIHQAAESALEVLLTLVNTAESMNQARCTLETDIDLGLHLQDIIESLVMDSIKIACTPTEEETQARAYATAPHMGDRRDAGQLKKSVVLDQVIREPIAVDQTRRDRLVKLQQKIEHSASNIRSEKSFTPHTSPLKPSSQSVASDINRNVHEDDFTLPINTPSSRGMADHPCSKSIESSLTRKNVKKSRNDDDHDCVVISQVDTEEDRARNMAESRMARTVHVHSWAADQVDWAKQRKKLWKNQKIIKAKQTSSDVPSLSKNAPVQQHQNVINNKKSDSGTMIPTDSISQVTDLSETVSQMKLRTDIMLAHLSIATRPYSSKRIKPDSFSNTISRT